MSSVFIPLGGAGGKNRGEGVQVDENYTYLKLGNSGVGIPLPAGNYKALKAVHGEENPFSSYGDGKNAAVFMTKDFLKKVTLDLFGIASITNFSLSMYAHRQVRLTWAKPLQGLWSGTHFVFKYDSMPTNENDGFMVYDSADVHYESGRLEERELFVRAYSYVTVKDGRWYDEGKVSARISVTGISGSVTLSTGAGTWTVPEGVRRIRYILVGHGGAGIKWMYGGGGGGGGYFTTGYMDVTPGQSLLWIVPTAQGQATVLNGAVANSGNSPEKLLSPISYNQPYQYIDDEDHRVYTRGGSGGSGGGGGWMSASRRNNSYSDILPGGGGTNGSMGYGTASSHYFFFNELQLARGGDGQGSSTLGFNGVLYCGGGGGSGFVFPNAGHPSKIYCQPKEQDTVVEQGYHFYRYAGLGGAGGGGHGKGSYLGGVRNEVATSGTDGLGGGGGGAEGDKDYRGRFIAPKGDARPAGLGGTGCIYIAWGSLMND